MKHLDQIQKLLNLTQTNGASEAEAASAMEFARRLMDAHGVTMADVDALRADPKASADATYERAEDVAFKRTRSLNMFEQSLSCHVGDLTDTRPVVWTSAGIAHLKFVGDAKDVPVAVATYQMLLAVGRRLATAHGKACHDTRYPRFRSFMDGFSCGVRDQVREIKARSADQFTNGEAETFALVSVSKDDWLARVMDDMDLIKRKGGGSNGRHYDNAYGQGHAHGKSADLNVRGRLS